MFGRGSRAWYPRGVVFGPASRAWCRRGVAAGRGSRAWCHRGVGVGRSSRAWCHRGVGVGRSSRAWYPRGVAVGRGSRAWYPRGVAVGRGSRAWYPRGVGVGPASRACCPRGVVFGLASLLPARNAISTPTPRRRPLASTHGRPAHAATAGVPAARMVGRQAAIVEKLNNDPPSGRLCSPKFPGGVPPDRSLALGTGGGRRRTAVPRSTGDPQAAAAALFPGGGEAERPATPEYGDPAGSAVVNIFFALLLSIIRFAASLISFYQHSLLDECVRNTYFLFELFNVFFVYTIGGSILTKLNLFVDASISEVLFDLHWSKGREREREGERERREIYFGVSPEATAWPQKEKE